LEHPSTICRSYGAGRFPQMNADWGGRAEIPGRS